MIFLALAVVSTAAFVALLTYAIGERLGYAAGRRDERRFSGRK